MIIFSTKIRNLTEETVLKRGGHCPKCQLIASCAQQPRYVYIYLPVQARYFVPAYRTMIPGIR